MKPTPSHRGRATPSEPALTSPLPQTPTPLECGDVDDGVLCSNTHPQHQQQHTHQQHVLEFITRNYGVIGGASLIRRYGIEAVHETALELYPSWDWNGLRGIDNPGGFFVWKLRQAEEIETTHRQRRNLRIVGDS